LDHNKFIARRFIEEVWGKGDLELANKIIASDFVDHMPLPGQAPGRAGHNDVLGMVHAAFPNREITLTGLIAEGDRVVDFWTFRATHLGDFMGVPGTGKRVEFNGIDITRVVDGQIAEMWHVEELLFILHQIGAVPVPA
jgi:steroid delta-isomerase-like uncharacterized protein